MIHLVMLLLKFTSEVDILKSLIFSSKRDEITNVFKIKQQCSSTSEE